MTADDRRVLRDPELVELLADEPELLAIADAYAATQPHRHHRDRRWRRAWRLGLLAAAVAAIAAPAAAFADQIGRVLGFSDGGTPVATDRIPTKQLSALEQIGFPAGHVRLLATHAGVSFYAARAADGNYCFAIGFDQDGTPSIDALACQGGAIGSFPSTADPVADFSAIDATPAGTYITTLAGFATDRVSRVNVVDPAGNVLYSTPVQQNIYAASDIPQHPAAAIVALDNTNTVIYRRQLNTPPIPRPASTSTTP
jgi:hypothetical protein